VDDTAVLVFDEKLFSIPCVEDSRCLFPRGQNHIVGRRTLSNKVPFYSYRSTQLQPDHPVPRQMPLCRESTAGHFRILSTIPSPSQTLRICIPTFPHSHMSLQQHPEGYAQAKEELLEYWHESGTIIPLEDIPYVWPESPPPSTELPPSVRETIPPFNLSLDETFSVPDDQATYLTDPLDIPDPEDILNTGNSEPLDMIFLLPRHRNGVDHFRNFGPHSMIKAVVSIPKVDSKGEDGMDIPADTGDVVKAFENDAKMRVAQEDADYLRSIISRINVEKSVDIVLQRVLYTKDRLTVA
jgi:hypothetical protein